MAKAAMRFSEVVLQTSQYETLKAWYVRMLETQPMFESEPTATPGPSGATRICFIRPYTDFPFTETLAIFEVPALKPSDGSMTGMNHFQMRFASVGDLFDRYEALKLHGIVPARCSNHGPATSFYYRDPDGNRLELSAMNYATEAEMRAFMASEAFRKNPSGIDVDPDEYVGRFRRGVPIEELRRIPEMA